MQHTARKRLGRTARFVALAATAAFVAGCAAPSFVASKKRSKEYFAESEYGVKASPRVTTKLSGLPRGGGRDQLGSPYKVRGKWYYPKEDPAYVAVGPASWYGDAFHGRLTANGEVYDMTNLTAAHPTMPLPSYARVTNTANGNSVIVRVNDRGPYSDGRVIDLSKRAAEMLGYARSGTANVQVEYVGRAPLDGQDDQYLLASYRPGPGMGDPTNDGLPTGVMVAMNGPTPSVGVGAAFPAAMAESAPVPVIQANVPVNTLAAQAAQFEQQPAMAAQDGYATQDDGYVDVVLPDFGPIAPERPDGMTRMAINTLSYASERVAGASRAFDALQGQAMSSDDIVNSWKRLNPGPRAAEPKFEAYVAAGTFDSDKVARRIADELAAFGRTAIEQTEMDGKTWYSVELYSDGRNSLDAMLKAAWSHGAPDAFAVHD